MNNMKLELKHISPYLPYGLKFQYLNEWSERYDTQQLVSLSTDKKDCVNSGRLMSWSLEEIKPILRPIYDLLDTNTAKELNSISSFVFVYDLRYKTLSIQTDSALDIELNDMVEAINILYANHFDVFGLIEKGLAIDINTLNK